MEESIIGPILIRAFSGFLDMPLIPIVAVGLTVLAVLWVAAGPRSRSKRSSKAWPQDMPKQISGRAHVSDGDDIEVGGYTIRLAGIDAPEHKQMATDRDGRPIDQGKMAKDALFTMVHGEKVRVIIAKRKRTYKRLIGTVYLGKRDICREMVREGFAYSAYGEQYQQEEEEARQEKRGIWAHEGTIPPWLQRKNKRRWRE